MPGEPATRSDGPDAPNSPDLMAAFEAVPDTMIAQIIDGELVVQHRPGRPHTNSTSVLGGELHGPFRRGVGGPGGWIILDEPELQLGRRPDILVPDLAGWRRERMPDAIGADTPAFYDLAPDWVCEVLSPSTERVDRLRKMRIYGREGVAHVWLINPAAQTLEVYRREGARWLLIDTFGEAERVRAEPFDAIELDLALLWAG